MTTLEEDDDRTRGEVRAWLVASIEEIDQDDVNAERLFDELTNRLALGLYTLRRHQLAVAFGELHRIAVVVANNAARTDLDRGDIPAGALRGRVNELLLDAVRSTGPPDGTFN